MVEACSREPEVVNSNLTTTISFHLEIWFFEIFHRGPYFVGFQTKWIITHSGTYYNAVIVFLMFFYVHLISAQRTVIGNILTQKIDLTHLCFLFIHFAASVSKVSGQSKI